MMGKSSTVGAQINASSAPKKKFNVEAAMAAGYTQDEINQYLSSNPTLEPTIVPMAPVTSQNTEPQLGLLQKAGRSVAGGLSKGLEQTGRLLAPQTKELQKTEARGQAQINNIIRQASAALRNGDKEKARKLLAIAGQPMGGESSDQIITNGEGFATPKEIYGGAAKLAINLASVGGVGGAAANSGKLVTASELGMGPAAKFLAGQSEKVLGRVAGRAAEGALYGGAGAAADAVQNDKNVVEEALKGAKTGALFGGGLQGAGEVAKGAKKAAGWIAAEGLGKTTGAGAGPIREAYEKPSKELVAAMRGKTAPEDVVQKAEQALEIVKDNRRSQYLEQMSKVDKSYQLDANKAKETFLNTLQKFNGVVDDTGKVVIPANSPLKAQEGLIQQAFDAVNATESTTNIDQLDMLKQTLDELTIPTDKRSRANVVISATRSAISKELESVPGYKEAVKEYATTSKLLEDIKQAVGNTKNRQAAFSKLTTSMRDNQQFRRAMVDALDNAAGTNISGEIAGAALSGIAPRGLSGAVAGSVGTGAALLNPQLLMAAPLMSPRVVGEAAVAGGRINAAMKKAASKAKPAFDAARRAGAANL